MIKVGAHRVAPKEIEEVLLEHPLLLEAAVLGVPDDVLGEVIEAHVVARPQAAIDLDELAAFARERLPAYKVPGRFFVRLDLPKSAAGKILKESLRSAPGGR
jgi:feruloyl-CoA synthase